MRIRWFVLSLAFSLSAVNAVRADLDKDSVWGKDFAAAEEEAKQLNRPLVVHFWATWCGPCNQMEREVLATQPVLKTLDGGYVAVKVNYDKNPKVVKRFNITSIPADLIIAPDGKILASTVGYDGSVRQKYLSELNRIDKQYAKAGTRLPRKAPGETKPQEIAIADNNQKPVAKPVTDKLVPQPTEPKKVGVPENPVVAQSDDPANSDDLEITRPTIESSDVQIAMEGYCPVTLRNTRTWKPGNKEISLEHQGQTYYFLTDAELKEFKGNPARFAPRLLGCDPVVLTDSDLAVRGNTKFGAYYDGALFLFESSESRAKFKKTPIRYAQLKHTLNSDEVKRLASAANR